MSGTSIVCVECGRKFLLSYEEQRYCRERGWTPTKRCPECRSRHRYANQSGMRGLVGPHRTSSPWLEQTQEEPTLRIHPCPPIPLWRAMSRARYHRHLSQFLGLDASAMSALEVPEFALLLQWIFEQHGLGTYGVLERDGGLDLALRNKECNCPRHFSAHCSRRVPFLRMYAIIDLDVTKVSWEHPCEGSEPSQGSTKFSQTQLI